MTRSTKSLSYQCRNYESILSVVSLIPEPAEALSKDAGCDTCIHSMSGNCDIATLNIKKISLDGTDIII